MKRINGKKVKRILSIITIFAFAFLAYGIWQNVQAEDTSGKIELTKTATKTYEGADENNKEEGRFTQVTLGVSANPYNVSEESIPELDIILVVDGSGSMAFNTSGSQESNVPINDQRITLAKNAARDFANTLMDSSCTASKDANNECKVRIGMIEFGTNIKNSQTLTGVQSNITGTNGSISKWNANGGTNLHAGIEAANTMFSQYGRNDAKKIVIFLTDGIPTYFNYTQTYYESRWVGGIFGHYEYTKTTRIERAGKGNSDDKVNICYEYNENNSCINSANVAPSEAAKAELDSLKKTYTNADVYTIAFGDEDAYTSLETINIKDTTSASHTYENFKALTGDELKKKFREIAENAQNLVGTGSIVTDIIPKEFILTKSSEEKLEKLKENGIEVVKNEDGTTTLKWNIGSINATTSNNLTYEVEALPEYYGTIYTNSSAILKTTVDENNPYYEETELELEFDKPITVISVKAEDDSYKEIPSYEAYNGVTINGTSILENDNNKNQKTDGKTTLKDTIIINTNDNVVKSSDNVYKIYKDNKLQGTLTMNTDGTFTFDAEKGVSGEVTFTYYIETEINPGIKMEDETITKVRSNNATVTLNIKPRNTITITGKKVWDDNNNQDGKRLPKVTINLLQNNKKIDSQEVTAKEGETDTWNFSFDNLYEYEVGYEGNEDHKYTYTVDEETVGNDYVKKVEGTTITNTRAIEQYNGNGDLIVTKVWDDNDNQDGKRTSVNIELFADGVDTGKSITLGEDNNWTSSFEELVKNNKGTAIKYTIKETTTIDGYTASISEIKDGKVSVTNKLTTPEKFNEDGNLTVTKVWRDKDDQDKIRPNSVTITLYADGISTGKTITLSETNEWSDKFTNLDKNSKGKEIEYTVKETTIDGYTTGISEIKDGNITVTNIHTTEKTSLSVTKVWDDNNNQDGIRPTSVTITLYANDKVTDKTITLGENNNWTSTFEELEKNEAGTPIKYTIKENTITGYTASISYDTEFKNATVTNTLTDPEKYNGDGKLTVTKVWDDNNNQDGKRTEVTIKLYADNKDTGKTITLNEDNNWESSFKDLAKNNKGTAIQYTIEEIQVEGYNTPIYDTTTAGSYTVTNKITSYELYNEDGKLTVTKVWDDNDNQDGKRTEVTIKLYADGVDTGKSIALNEDNNWSDSFTELAKNNKGTEIKYTIEETQVEGYNTPIYDTTTVGSYTVTNKITSYELYNEDGNLTVTKVWDDNNNQDGKRTEVTIKLYADGVDTGKTITLSDDNNWSDTFTELAKNSTNGKTITYTIEETQVDGYNEPTYDTTTAGTYTVTNKITSYELYNEDGKLTVTKVWDDNDNQDGKRTEVTIKLYADGVDTGKSITLNEDNNWSDAFTELVKNNKGNEIKYTVEEVKVEGYKTETSDIKDGKITVTNTLTNPEKFNEDGNLTVTKVWNDNNDQDGKRSSEITIKLYADGVDTGKTINLNTSNNWTDKFTNLDKNNKGKEITYTIKEVEVADYNTEISEIKDGKITVTNTHTTETTEVIGKKIWNDNNNQDGKRPESINIKLYANGEYVTTGSFTAGENNNWTYAFTNLDKYSNGKLIEYTILEEEVSEYETTYDEKNPYIIINTHKTATINIEGTKTWEDNNNQDGIRPDSITVRLYADGEYVENSATTVTESDNWSYKYTNLDMYKDGKLISYTINEDAVEGYSTEINGYDIKNIHTPETITINGTKTWNDNNNQDGKRPESITINLLVNSKIIDSKEVTESDNWSYEFTDLDKYKDGKEIQYIIEEESVDGYTTTIDNYNITNTHEVEKITFNTTKIWDDNDNQDGIRTEEVIVKLYKNGELIDTVTINEQNNWTYTFENLDRYSEGKEITYTITEEVVEGYDTTIDYNDIDENNIISVTITNKHTPELYNGNGTLEITKTWEDLDNYEGIRPDSINVKFYADGIYIDTVTITSEKDWKYIIENLYKYKNGKEITYTIEEELIDGYITTYNGFNIINTHEFGKGGDEEVEVLPPQTGVDYNNKNIIIYILSILTSLLVFCKKIVSNI